MDAQEAEPRLARCQRRLQSRRRHPQAPDDIRHGVVAGQARRKQEDDIGLPAQARGQLRLG